MCEYISDIEHIKQILNNTQTPLILYFTASWCGPCKMISPIVDELKNCIANMDFIKLMLMKPKMYPKFFK